MDKTCSAERSRRRRELREAIYRSYDLMAADPQFMAEHERLTEELDRTIGDGASFSDSSAPSA